MFVEFDNAGLACYVKRDEGGWREDTRGHFRHAPRFSADLDLTEHNSLSRRLNTSMRLSGCCGASV